MRFHQKCGWLLFLLSFASPTFASSLCEEEILALTPHKKTLISFMDNPEPVQIKNNRYLTYSHDTELDTPDWISYIQSDKESAKKLDKAIPPLKLSELKNITGLNEEELEDFAFKGELKKRGIKLSDLNPEYGAMVFQSQATIEDWHTLIVEALFLIEKISDKRNEPFKSHLDAAAIEITHSSFEKTPEGAKKFTNWIYDTFSEPNAHLHIGLPHSAIGSQQALAVSRAVETLVILERATRDYNTLNKLPFSNGTPLKSVFDRGPVYLKMVPSNHSFREPFLAHDLEIRQYEGRSSGLALLGLATKLSENAPLLHLGSRKTYGRVLNDQVGNLPGALLYASELLGRKGNSHLATQLKKKASQFLALQGNTRSIYRATRKLLVDNQITELLSDWKIYLK